MKKSIQHNATKIAVAAVLFMVSVSLVGTRPGSATIAAMPSNGASNETTVQEADRTDVGDRSSHSYAARLESVGRLLSKANERLKELGAASVPRAGTGADDVTLEQALETIQTQAAEATRLAEEIETKFRGVVDFPGRFRSLQEALDAVPDGGTLRIATGTYSVDSPLYIRSKRVFVRGPGRIGADTARFVAPLPLRVVPARDADGVFNFVDAGGGLEGFEVTGGDAAVVMRGTANTPLEVKNVKLARNGRGILHLAPADLTVKDSVILDSLWNGISFAPKNAAPHVLPHLIVEDSQVFCFQEAAENMGIYVSHGSLWTYQTALGGWAGGGIGLEASSAIIDDPFLIQNGTAGIIMWLGSQASIADANIQNTLAHTSGVLGDGISVWCSQVLALTYSDVVNSARTSAFVLGGELSVDHSTLRCSIFDMVVDSLDAGNGPSFCATPGLHQPILHDPFPGSVQCGCPGQGQPLGNCALQGGAPQAPGPIGGLE